jgi:hypothetical protein
MPDNEEFPSIWPERPAPTEADRAKAAEHARLVHAAARDAGLLAATAPARVARQQAKRS